MTASKIRNGPLQLNLFPDRYPLTQADVDVVIAEMTALYLESNPRPWIIGFSGGKDSSAVVQLVIRMLLTLAPEQRTRPVWIISSDTRVENPAVSDWLLRCHDELRQVAQDYRLPLHLQIVRPSAADTFWVQMLGKGLPAPTTMFRWCTSRLKIDPAEAFILSEIDPEGRVVQILGSRKAESQNRARSIQRSQEKSGEVEGHPLDGKLGAAGSLANAVAYMPIVAWDNGHVWEYLRLWKAPWRPDYDDANNAELFALYGEAHGGECVLDFDRSINTCGGSRFGCYTCTVVERDHSMTNMVEYSRPELAPLVALRDRLVYYRAPRFRRKVGRNGRLRINSYARRAAATSYAEEISDPEVVSAFEAGAKWMEQSWGKPNQIEMHVASDQSDRGGLWPYGFSAGAMWAEQHLGAPDESEAVTPGPMIPKVRLAILARILKIERGIGLELIGSDELDEIRTIWDREEGVGQAAILDHLRTIYNR
jgi:putative sulfurtransferase DndC